MSPPLHEGEECTAATIYQIDLLVVPPPSSPKANDTDNERGDEETVRDVHARVRQEVNLILHVNHDDKKVDVQDEGGGDLHHTKKITGESYPTPPAQTLRALAAQIFIVAIAEDALRDVTTRRERKRSFRWRIIRSIIFVNYTIECTARSNILLSQGQSNLR